MAAIRTQETVDTLCEALERNAGDVALACAEAGCSVGWLKRWMRDDPKVEAAINDAVDTGATVLESAMIKRAVHGYKEKIFFKDQCIGTKRRYSDSLLVKALESRLPDKYGKRVDVNQNIRIQHLSDTELDSKIDMLMGRLGMTALPAPDNAVDAEFEEIISVEDLL